MHTAHYTENPMDKQREIHENKSTYIYKKSNLKRRCSAEGKKERSTSSCREGKQKPKKKHIKEGQRDIRRSKRRRPEVNGSDSGGDGGRGEKSNTEKAASAVVR